MSWMPNQVLPKGATLFAILTTAVVAVLIPSEPRAGHARIAADQLAQLRGSSQSSVTKSS